MLSALLLLAAGATNSAAPTPPAPLPLESETRKVVEVQLNAPPRDGHQLSPEERAAITRLYVQSIGKPAPQGQSGSSTGTRTMTGP